MDTNHGVPGRLATAVLERKVRGAKRSPLTLEAHFQQQAHENMRAGGRYKGLANLPEAQFIDVLQRIADAAGVGARNVSKVKSILRAGHPRLIAAVTNDVLSIDAAMRC